MDVEAAERIRLVPNCSLSVRAATLFFASLCATSFGIAALCAARGFWPVLPFAGGEMFFSATQGLRVTAAVASFAAAAAR